MPELFPLQPGPWRTVRELLALYDAHCRVYYRRADGKPTREHLNLAASLKHLACVDAGGGLCVADLAVDRLARTHVRQMRLSMIHAGLLRTYINRAVGNVRRFLRWAISEELAPAALLGEIAVLTPLQPGRSGAKEPVARSGVNPAHFDAVVPILPRIPRAVCQLGKLTGARSGELLGLTTAEVNRDDPDLWWAIPVWHKAAHKGRRRAIPLDARCRAILAPLLRPAAPTLPIFASPRNPSKAYRRDSIAAAITRACKRAGVPAWTLHQIRHRAATTVRDRAGLDAAQALLGHARSSTTEIYAPVANPKAAAAQEFL